jgi:cytochrome oxidase Cu insertion factor (SCO1/SenC/PrrC family)
MKKSQIASALSILTAVLIGVIAVIGWFGPMLTARDEGDGNAAIGGPFELIDQHGRTVTDKDFRGRPMLIYFGFAYCPDICPTSLARNAAALDLLGKEGEAIQPILITVDPERDTPELLKRYAEAFDPRLIALTGSPEQIAAVAKAYRVFYKKVEEGRGPGDYLIDHSAFTYLIDGEGHFRQFFRHDLSAEAMAERLRAAL